ncbi:MAG TPA: ATP-binding cassette domain-containing protein [Stellaceae bacterium]|nr:ATP-binding cassette domain-containing protein [Stellaceae bacterium]
MPSKRDVPKVASTPAIELRGLCTRVGGEVLHDHLDLVIYPGEIVGLVGASGSGKSVLLQALLGLMPPEAGEIRIFGTDIGEAPVRHIRRSSDRHHRRGRRGSDRRTTSRSEPRTGFRPLHFSLPENLPEEDILAIALHQSLLDQPLLPAD